MTNNDLPNQTQNPEKDPEDWTTGDEPMTGPQASYLQTLLQQAGRDDEFDPRMSKRKASELIDHLQEKTGRGQDQGNDS